MNMQYRLSNAANKLEGQPMFKLLSIVQKMEAAGKNIIHFEIGDPDFDTPKSIVKAACDSLNSGETHYTNSHGMKELIEVVRETTFKSRGFKPSADQILICPGANIIIYYTVSCLVNPGDEVIVPDPGFPTYNSVINFVGAKSVSVPLKESREFRIDPEDIRSVITSKTRLIILNSPQNPTGAVMTSDDFVEIMKIAEEFDIYIYSDEIYSRMIFDKKLSFATPAQYDLCKKRIIIANGLSKAFAMTGWRIGVAIGPEDVIGKMNLLLQTTSSCVSPFIQRAAIEAISGSQECVVDMMKEYKIRRDLLVDGLNDIKGIKCLKPHGAFYVFPNITGTRMTSAEFANYILKEANVSLLPGTDFGISGEGYVRLCYATSQDNIKEGLIRIKKALEKIE